MFSHHFTSSSSPPAFSSEQPYIVSTAGADPLSPLECLKNQPTTTSPSPPHTAASSMYPTYKHFPTPQRGSLSSSLGATEIVTQNLNPDPPTASPGAPAQDG